MIARHHGTAKRDDGETFDGQATLLDESHDDQAVVDAFLGPCLTARPGIRAARRRFARVSATFREGTP